MKFLLAVLAVLVIALGVTSPALAEMQTANLYAVTCLQDCSDCPGGGQCQYARLGGETWSAVSLVKMTKAPVAYTKGGAKTYCWRCQTVPAAVVPVPTYRPVYRAPAVAVPVRPVCAKPLVVGVPTNVGYFYTERRLGLLGLRGKVVQYHQYGP